MNRLIKILIAAAFIWIFVYPTPDCAAFAHKSFVDEIENHDLLFEEDPTDEFLSEKREMNRICAENQVDEATYELLTAKLEKLISKETAKYGEIYSSFDTAFAVYKIVSMYIGVGITNEFQSEFNAQGAGLKDELLDENNWKELDDTLKQIFKDENLMPHPELYFRIDKELVNICEEVLGESEPITLKRTINLIQDYSVLGDSKVALEMSEELLPKIEKAFGSTSNEVTEVLNIMANDYKILGNYQKSEETLLKLIAVNKKLHGEESSAKLAENLVALSKLRMSTSTSEPELYSALEKAAKNLPGEDLYESYIETMNNPVYDLMKHWDLEDFETDILESEEIYGRDRSTKVLDAQIESAEGYRLLGHYEHALTGDLMTIGIGKMLFRNYHHKILRVICNLSDNYLRLNQPEEALLLAQKAFNTSQKIYGNEHPCTIYALHSLTNVYRKMGRYDDALKKDLEAYELCAKTFVKSSAGEPQENLTVLMDIAADHKGLKNYPEAIKLYEQILLSFDSNDRLAIKIAEVRQNLAYLYNRSGEYEKTVKLYDFLKKDDYFYSLNKLKVRGLIAAYTANVLGDALAVVGKKSADKYHIAHYIYYQSIEELEDMRSDDQDFYSEVTYSTSENRQGWFSQTVPYYQKAATFFLNQDDNDEAFRAIELCKGRTLADQYSDLLAIYKGGLSDSEIVKLNEYQKKSLQYKDKFSKEFNHGSDNLKFNLMLAQLGTMKDYIS